jgi:hypothetical protein
MTAGHAVLRRVQFGIKRTQSHGPPEAFGCFFRLFERGPEGALTNATERGRRAKAGQQHKGAFDCREET